MATIGQTLSAARVAAGHTIADLSARTRIREPVLMSIEQEDFVPCGGDFYARGHIRGICRALGLDPAPLLEEYDREHATGAIPAFIPPQRHPAATPGGVRASAAARTESGAGEDGADREVTHRFGDDDSGVGSQRWGHFERRQVLEGAAEEEPPPDLRRARVPAPRGSGEGRRGAHRAPEGGTAHGGSRGPVYGRAPVAEETDQGRRPVYGRVPEGRPVNGEHVHGRSANGERVPEGRSQGETPVGGSRTEERFRGLPVDGEPTEPLPVAPDGTGQRARDGRGGPVQGGHVYRGPAHPRHGVPQGTRHPGGVRGRGGRPAPRPKVAGARHHRAGALRRHWPWAVICGILVLAVLIGVRTWQDWDTGDPLRAALDSSEEEGTVDSAVRSGGSEGAAEAVQAETGEFTVELAASGRSWVEITEAGGEDLYVGFLLDGETQDYVTEENLNMWIGDAGAVTVTVNGEDLGPLGLPGEVKEVIVGPDGLVH
ncbi:helix-turn-helix domain-containing protein [Nocardiopsis sp. ATB16-24]|uniref:helix-turn-helix domain-containing protein n=1 Tax=Nocardiopsis sp. ATB16-24 TaxID=3019555 RepID=UPI002555AAD7|nr:helix-turn-helix domain-containing protein [Nocardiopsis sp. ATB16-24]